MITIKTIFHLSLSGSPDNLPTHNTTGASIKMAGQTLFVFLLVVLSASAVVRCLNNEGKGVDWWVILKYPILSQGGDVGSGFAYTYADAKSPSFKYSSLRLDSDGAIPNTLNQVYNNSGSDSIGYLMYNDESPDGSQHESFAHMKGVMGFDSKVGFLLSHSVPRWPPASSDSYNYPDGQAVYGQSFLCLSLSTPNLDLVGGQLLIDKPHLYDSNLPDSITTQNLAQVVSSQWIKDGTTNFITISTLAGEKFDVFAKNEEADVELWDDVVEPQYQSGMLVESWMNGGLKNKMPTVCTPDSKYNTMNVRTVAPMDGVQWTETKDHSKWAVTTDVQDVFCIGDINRQFSQAKRGGGAICGTVSSIWKDLTDFISESDPCPN
ncbi:hypothetical protein PROFUN_07040 [Planoprotostelium fungivorum]|uniref:Uncharacterized protein n=1 Tax=Planoprotostelium fungivorum TaxID=1890364 RepID=A0A2P6NMS2_9EUKA|nr:hypothetical protein PROFUN_07040 [Planoprotostelium fungivorum]